MGKYLILFLFLNLYSYAKGDSVNLEKVYNEVFSVYQSVSEPFLKEFAENQYKKPSSFDQDYKMLVAARLEVYRNKVSSLKKDYFEGIKNKHFEMELEAVGYISGYLDFAFRLEFPGLDYRFYDEVGEKVSKLFRPK